jgi:eukaryotic-like serine/threonine-protein kinase
MGEPRRRCSNCGESYAEGVIFCPRDGSALSLRALDSGPDPYLGQTITGAFRVEALIGTGAVGRVYRAHQLGVERSVALKIMHRDLAANETLQSRFRREARVAGSLTHPNLVSVLSLGEFESGGVRVPFLAFEYLDGLSLRSAFLAQGALPRARALHIMLQIADAVGVAHEHGIVHRDLKPENVMLVPDEQGAGGVRAVVMDFGLAKERRQEPEVAKLTATGIVLGTPEFMSPEQIRGKLLDLRSDIYALAIVGFEMFTGQLPFQGRNAQEMMIARLRGKPKLLREVKPDLPGRLEQVLNKAMSLDPGDRFSTMGAFAEAIEGAEESGVFARLFRK